MPINSRSKGARGERLWRDELRAQGFQARRGQQFSGSPDSPDVICQSLPSIHWEVKCVESLNLREAMAQAVRDANGSPVPKIPVVAHKRNHGEWLVTMRSCEWFNLLRETSSFIVPIVTADKCQPLPHTHP